MGFVFLDEIGVEPVAFVGQISDVEISIPDSIHRLYSGSKANVQTQYKCGRYVTIKEENRLINMTNKGRFIETSKIKGDCK